MSNRGPIELQSRSKPIPISSSTLLRQPILAGLGACSPAALLSIRRYPNRLLSLRRAASQNCWGRAPPDRQRGRDRNIVNGSLAPFDKMSAMPWEGAQDRKAPQHRVHPTGGSRRVFKPFVWLGVGSVKVALPRPAHPRVTLPVGRLSPNIRKSRAKCEKHEAK